MRSPPCTSADVALTKVKPSGTAAAKRRRNRVGQPAQHFFETAIAGYEDKFVQAFSDSLKRQENTFYER